MGDFNRDVNELGIVQSASKIWEKINILRNLDEREKMKYSRRWIWELLQNAKDVSNETVNVKINYHHNQIIFFHDGRMFSCKDLLSLITQTSFKEFEYEEATGKFGTGFITTHLICEKIHIVGLICDYSGRTKKLDFYLDRSGKTRAEIQNQVKDQLENIEKINGIDAVTDASESLFPTSFIYEIHEDVSDIVQHGISELFYCAPYVLAFVPKIDSITILGQNEYIFKVGIISNCNELFRRYDFEQQKKSIIVYNNNDISIGIPIQIQNVRSINKLEETIPKVYCGFPLVGTENFPLPTIINSRLFEITEPRDGIMLGSEKNKELLKSYIFAYQILLSNLAQEKYINLYLLCKIGNSEDKWLQNNILDELKFIYKRIPIVQTLENELCSIENENGDVNILFPYETDHRVKNDIWDLCAGFYLGQMKLPVKEENLNWVTVVKEDKFRLSLNKILEMLNKLANVDDLQKKLKENVLVVEWINFLLIILHKKEELQNELAKYKIIPNQNGEFCFESKLKKDDKISDELKDILVDLGEDIRSSLRNQHIVIPEEENKESLSNIDIASKIRLKIYELLQKENEPGGARTEHTKKVFEKLILWFSNNSQEAERIFLDIYEHKHKLYDDNEIIKNIQLSQEITKIMQDNGITEIQQIKDIIENSTSKEVISNVSLACMGITNEEEFERAFENEDVKSYFTYVSNPTKESYLYVQEIIQRAKTNIISYLMKYPEEYDCSLYQETATTIIAGIKKNGKPIKIVVRPSDGDKIYLYYQSELDTMDYEDYELWVDNNDDDPRQITFGKLLKITGVKVIPLRKIFY